MTGLEHVWHRLLFASKLRNIMLKMTPAIFALDADTDIKSYDTDIKSYNTLQMKIIDGQQPPPAIAPFHCSVDSK